MTRVGLATLPLHSGAAPRWLFERMVRLSRALVAALVEDLGPEGVLRRLADPFWFQALGCLLGFDWHSSGVTTTVCAALKAGLRGLEREFGLVVAGGKGAASRRTPEELREAGARWGLDADRLVHASRLAAKVDSNALQDGYRLYHHTFVATLRGGWAVSDFVCEPHAAVCCDTTGPCLNLVASESASARQAITELARERPAPLLRELARLQASAGPGVLSLTMPRRHAVALADIDPRRLATALLQTYEAQAPTFEALLGLPGIGARTLRALALLSEVLAGTPLSWRDPTRFSFAHGGKDGHPFPVDRTTYDRTVAVLEDALRRARLGEPDRLRALRRLHTWVRAGGPG